MDNRLKPESKKSIIECAHRVLMNDGFEGFSIRKVAKECGCGVSSVYRHFSCKDELILYAAIRNLEPYLNDLTDVWQQGENSLWIYFLIEKAFAKYSFEEPVLFYNMYFGPAANLLDNIFLDSMELYHDSYANMMQELRELLSAPGGIGVRNLAMLKRCRQDGLLHISESELELLTDSIVRLYRGYVDEAVRFTEQGRDTRELMQTYLAAHRMIHRPYISSEQTLPNT